MSYLRDVAACSQQLF